MSCKACDEAQHSEWTAFIRWKNANVEIRGCQEHVGEVMATLNGVPSGMMTPVRARVRTLQAAAPKLLEALKALYTFPRVRDLLAPRGSLGSIDDMCCAAIKEAEGGL